jgi:hypothetical protein
VMIDRRTHHPRRKAWNRYSFFRYNTNPGLIMSYQLVSNFDNNSGDENTSYDDSEDSQLVKDAKKSIPEPSEYNYTERDVVLYNLGIGATEKELQWTFEGHEDFAAIPTFGVIPQFMASSTLSLDWLPNYSPVSTKWLAFILRGSNVLR